MIGVEAGDVTSEEVCGHGRNKDPGSSSIEVAPTALRGCGENLG